MRILVLVVLFLVVSCSESFPPPSAVTEFRVVAARVDVTDEPGRANPSPDDDVRISVLSIDRGVAEDPEVPAFTPAPLQWAFIPCVPAPTTIGPPICLEAIEPCSGCVGAPPDDLLATPIVGFQVPSAQDLEEADASSVLLQGVVCSNGTPSQDAILRFLMGESDELVPCEGPPVIEGRAIQGRFVAIAIPIEDDPADPNFNPELLSLVLNGGVWPPPYDLGVPRDAPSSGCAADLADLSERDRMAHPRAGDDPSTINLAVTPESLQTFTVDDQDFTEEIQVSWLADGGAFEASFSFITDPARSILTQWRPFESVPEDGALVRFNFVIRDGRGGTDWVERGLCILPAEPTASPP